MPRWQAGLELNTLEAVMLAVEKGLGISFISRLAAEDRCHLNGLAMDGTRPAYVSAVSRSDVLDGWRERRRDGGVIIDVESGEVVASGFSMPHSPRLYDGRLWVLNSGRGQFGHVDPATGIFTPVAFCPYCGAAATTERGTSECAACGRACACLPAWRPALLRCRPHLARRPARLPASGSEPGAYLPLSTPRANGLNGTTPSP